MHNEKSNIVLLQDAPYVYVYLAHNFNYWLV
jgi:hypothetical protein